MKFKLNNNSFPAALRVSDSDDISIKTPSMLMNTCIPPKSIAAIIHVFYPELMREVAACINNFEEHPDLFISTDSEEKSEQIKQFCLQYPSWKFEIRVVENRGRDIAPMIVAFREVFYQYEYCLHLHTKKTLHKSAVAKWREYLYYNLCGTKEIVTSNLALLQNDKIGFIFPQNINVFRHNLSWGNRFENVKTLLSRSNIIISSDTLLEFPTSSMFIAKTASLKKLLEQDLQLSDFDIENHQITATLAHDIETSLLYFVEASGYRWVKVSHNHGNMIIVNNTHEVDIYLNNIVPQLLTRRAVEYKQLSLKTNGFCWLNSVKQKIFNVWQKILFKCWHPKLLFGYSIKNMDKS